MIDRYGHDEAALRDAGIAYTTEQISSLIAAGARGIHLYTMNDASVAGAVTRNIDSLIRAVNGKEAM
jgi:methylenetetrahydrofolate reductase (NADPH)